MIQIEEPPDVRACAGCQRPLVWLYSFRTGRTFSVVATSTSSFEVHQCRTGQDPVTWRHAYRGEPPSGEYLEARSKIAPRGYDG